MVVKLTAAAATTTIITTTTHYYTLHVISLAVIHTPLIVS